MDIEELEAWFQDRPNWLQDAARRLVQCGDLTEKDYCELFEICRGEVLDQSPAFGPLPAGSLSVQDTTKPLRLESISEVQGINALSPTKPLEFGLEQLCIVYGRNGTGKSGYVRLLKHACSARHIGKLEGNIFQEAQEPQSARFAFRRGGGTEEVKWSGGPIPALEGVDIYDTAGGLIYVNEENEVTFEPWLLRLFTRLTASCASLSRCIDDQIEAQVSKKPDLPPEYAATKAGAWYIGISAATSPKSVDEETAWTALHEAELVKLSKRLAESDPAAKAGALRRRKKSLLGLKDELQICLDRLSKVSCERFIDAKADAAAKRKAADEDANKVFESSPLRGVGSESWLLLWDAARKYSEEVYAGIPFPNIGEEARCVLCQQPLDTDGRERFTSFEDFVKGELRRSANLADQKVRELEALFPEVPASEALNTKLDAAGIEDTAVRDKVSEFGSALAKRRQACVAAAKREELPLGPPQPDVLALLAELATATENEAASFDEDARGENRPELEARVKDLSTRRWLSQQRKAIDEEITRLGTVATLNEMGRLTNTHALSARKGKLAEELITEAYVQRFQEELQQLDGSAIKVELLKTRTAAGRVYHKISLRNAKKNARTSDILSEGEFRIVSLAAFLADAEGRGAKTPFVFDDPISSLDHEYEEATAQRLAKLASVRQVIVFTHRLSLFGLLEKYTEKNGVKHSLLSLSSYRVGDVAELPIDLKRTDKAVNGLLNERLKGLKSALDVGDEAYRVEAAAMCRDIRILLERVVEKDLIYEVVRRFSSEVQTKGRIQALAKVTPEDCRFVDEYMTKYSRYEHSQPDETPIKLPKPDEIEEDLNAIGEFIKKIKGRNKH